MLIATSPWFLDNPAESQVTLYNLPDLSKPTSLPRAKTAFSFAVQTFVQHPHPDGRKTRPQDGEFSTPIIPVPIVITYLVVGCQRKLLVYSWKDGEAQDLKVRQLEQKFPVFLVTISQEAPLPHSARTITFLNSDILCLAYEAEHVLFSLDTMSTTEIASIPTTTKSVAGIGNVGMGALSGLGGYMTLGLGSKLRPCVTNVGDAQVLVVKDSACAGFLNRPCLIALQSKDSSSAQMASHPVRSIYLGQRLPRMLVRRANLRSLTAK